MDAPNNQMILAYFGEIGAAQRRTAFPPLKSLIILLKTRTQWS
jgi:hypothetical protein